MRVSRLSIDQRSGKEKVVVKERPVNERAGKAQTTGSTLGDRHLVYEARPESKNQLVRFAKFMRVNEMYTELVRVYADYLEEAMKSDDWEDFKDWLIGVDSVTFLGKGIFADNFEESVDLLSDNPGMVYKWTEKYWKELNWADVTSASWFASRRWFAAKYLWNIYNPDKPWLKDTLDRWFYWNSWSVIFAKPSNTGKAWETDDGGLMVRPNLKMGKWKMVDRNSGKMVLKDEVIGSRGDHHGPLKFAVVPSDSELDGLDKMLRHQRVNAVYFNDVKRHWGDLRPSDVLVSEALERYMDGSGGFKILCSIMDAEWSKLKPIDEMKTVKTRKYKEMYGGE